MFKMELHRFLMLCSVEIVLNLITIGSASKVPVFFWGKHCQPDLLPPVSALGSLSTDDFEAKYLNYFAKEKPLIAFLQDTLSLEDVAQRPSPYPHLEMHLRKDPSLILSSVESPLTALEKLAPTVVQSADLDEKSLSGILQDKPRVLLIQLPQTTNALDRKETLRANDMAMEQIVEMLVNTSSNFLLTAKNPSWNSKAEAESHVRMSRHLQAADFGNETDNFVNVSSLLYLYADKVTLLSNGTGSNTTYAMPPTVTSYSFSNSSSLANTSMTVDLTFSNSEKTDTIALHLDIELKGGKWWYVSSGHFVHNDESPINLLTSDIGASRSFSYSCGSTWLRAINSSAYIRFDRFQMEFMPRRDRFSESFSCSTFFTIPMWMGLMVIILFTVILASGVYLLFDVKTMDRFDDPKGKGITVPLTD